jgi:hypothetical protein
MIPDRPGKIRFSAARDPGKNAGKGDTSWHDGRQP